METAKSASGMQKLVALAYDHGSAQKKRREWFLPGKYYDIAVLGLFIVLGVGYFV